MAEQLIPIEEARENLLACAAFLAENIKSPDAHARAMQEIVPLYLEKGKVDLAAEFADTIDDPFIRDRLLIQVAEKCAAIDDDQYALQLVEAIEDETAQGTARERIVFQKSVKGEFEEALKLAAALDYKDNAFAQIALHRAIAEDEGGAELALAKIDFPQAKVVALQNIAVLQLQKGNNNEAVKWLERAVEAADEIEFSEEKIRAFFEIAYYFIDAKRNDKAIEIFDRAKTFAEEVDNILRDGLLAGAALGFLQAGSLDLADRTLDLVDDKTQMSSCLVGFSQVFWEKCERAEALETLQEAFAILKSQRDAETRDSQARYNLWREIAVQFVWFEKTERAIEVAQENPSVGEQMSALSQIAQVCASQNKDDFARQALRAIQNDEQRIYALIAVSKAKNGAGKREEAIETLKEATPLAETVPQLSLRSSVLNELVKGFLESGEAEKAREVSRQNLETITQIRDEGSRAAALAQVGEIYEQANFSPTAAEKEILQTLIRRAGNS